MLSIKNLSLSAYAFGYGCGFVRDNRPGAAAAQSLTLASLAEFCREQNLGGLEVPVDRYFPDLSSGDLDRFLQNMEASNLRVIFDLERLSAPYFRELAPIVQRHGGDFVRAKVCNFYGGNRFRESSYEADKNVFYQDLQDCVESMDRYGLRILVENHQDVTVGDLLELAEKFGSHRLGVNWDTGNSFPTGETTASFLQKTIHLIGNVHLKDYRFSSTDGGYVMHRCALGQGVVDFDRFVPQLIERSKGRMPFTIELGAMFGREALIHDDRYWTHTPGLSPDEIRSLTDFVRTHLEDNADMRSMWEKNAAPAEIAKAELSEVHESILYCKKLLNSVQ